MQGDEIRALRRLQREQALSSHVFMSERRWEPSPGAAALSCDFRTIQVYPKDG
jgi:hypothetical protein